ncbi:unnamed protein product [Adineta steineri]|uniref:SecA family profile domain-containing protein n=1 Tax=Adineta steineri TaxID=433720 RepID=A0A819QTJ9_9BILA|nr:unnamed protein product [Adineta steineri]CAF4029359.1 unnamed protein product [Adineta steineri]
MAASNNDHSDVIHQDTQQVAESSGNVHEQEKTEKRIYLENLRRDLINMPHCAEKTTMELLEYFERKLLNENTYLQEQTSIFEKLEVLNDQIKRQNLFSEQFQSGHQNLIIAIQNGNCLNAVCVLQEIVKKIRPLNVQEIQRLISKAKNAASLIHKKDIILLVGETGSGKSTMIHFLAGSNMQETRVQIAPGKFLDHIAAVGPFRNPELNSISTSPFNKSETRYIAPVTIYLADISAANETDAIILCDAPGFSDTSGPEVDIANSIGVIEALKGTNSVKLLALSSYKSVGDRGQGIQKLAHILSNMVQGIEGRLDAIVYAFTKYPPNEDDTNINSTLTDIKRSTVDKDPILRSDTAFVKILTHMIEETEDIVYKINPIQDERKKLIKKLLRGKGIRFPGEVFRFSMCEETRAIIANHVQRNHLSIISATKHKDTGLMKYYLDDLMILQNVLKESLVKDAYENSIRFISENLNEYCMEVKKRFNRALTTQDSLREDDIRDYKTAIESLQEMQTLKEHLQSDLLSPDTLIQNIISELNERDRILNEEELYSSLTVTYLNNLSLLRNSFRETENCYSNSCRVFEKRFDSLVQSAHEFISSNDFKNIAKTLLNVSKCLNVLKDHLGEKVEDAYHDIVKSFLRYLSSFSQKLDSLLHRLRFKNENIDIIKKYMDIIRSAKDCSSLQDRISTYNDMLNTGSIAARQYSSSFEPEEVFIDINQIYNKFLEQIIRHFEAINERIDEVFKTNTNYALEDVEKLVAEMDALRTVPEIEAKTAGKYFRTIGNIDDYMRQSEIDTHRLLFDIDHQGTEINYRHLSQEILRLKQAEWVNHVSPGAHDVLMRRITEKLVQHIYDLEERLLKKDYSLKNPKNIADAEEIIKKLQSMRDLGRTIPEIEEHRNNVFQRFLQCTQAVFDRIQKNFNLEDNDLYLIKQKLNNLEEIKTKYVNLHPTRIYLLTHEYVDINMLDNKIKELESRKKKELESTENELQNMKTNLNRLELIVQKYMNLNLSNTARDVYLRTENYSDISEVYEQITKIRQNYHSKSEQREDLNNEFGTSLNHLLSIKKEYDLRSAIRDSPSSEQIKFIQERGFNSYESLDKSLQEMRNILGNRENRQSYYFKDRLDAATAENALIYLNECEKISYDTVKQNAVETNANLKKYIKVYGDFLNEEIKENFVNIRKVNSEEGPFQYSYELKMVLKELSSLGNFKNVSDCIDRIVKVEHWNQEFSKCHCELDDAISTCRKEGPDTELKQHLIVAQALICADHFRGIESVSSGFEILYKQYHDEIVRDYEKGYKKILDNISKNAYAAVDMALTKIQGKSFSIAHSAQIKYDLTNSLDKLMKTTKSSVNSLDGKIEKDGNLGKIEEIKQNIDKIRAVFTQHSILNLLDDDTKKKMQTFNNEIPTMLSRIILRGLDFVEGFMIVDSFCEAKQGMDNLQEVKTELTGYYYKPQDGDNKADVDEKCQELQKRMNSLVNDIFERYNFENIKDYPSNPPKKLLAKLKAASKGDPILTKAYKQTLGKIRTTFNTAIEKVHHAPFHERSAEIGSLNYALNYFPENLKTEFTQKLGDLTKMIIAEEDQHKKALDSLFINVDKDEHIIVEIGLKAKEFKEKDMTKLLQTLCEQCLKKLNTYQMNIETSLNNQDITSAINILQKILKYKECVGDYIPQAKEIFNTVHSTIIKRFVTCCETLSNISSIEQTKIVEKAFKDIVIYLDFLHTLDEKVSELFPNVNKKVQELFSNDIMENCKKGFNKVFQYLNENSKKFHPTLNEMNLNELYKVMLISLHWETFSEIIRKCTSKHQLIQTLLKDMEYVIPYNDMHSAFEKIIEQLRNQFNVELINDKTTKFERERDKFFNDLMKGITIIREISSKFKKILRFTLDIERLEANLRSKVNGICKQLLDKASRPELSTRDTDDYRMYYYHLLSFEKYVHISGLTIRHVLEESEEKIFDKIRFLRREAIASSSNAVKVADLLIQMKFFAENLSIFDSNINKEIDETLKIYKDKEGSAGIMRLTVELEKNDVGTRIISEHSILTGEDWRQRREKMQKQDDIDYVLRNLTGTNVSHEILRVRYKNFREIYNTLVATHLKSSGQKDNVEPNLDMLITNTKYLIGTVVNPTKAVNWTESFKDEIPNILSHIFAIWTLKNTQHYNAMRGIREDQTYLLMPHIGQVIAIFRLLGIGYDSRTKVGGYSVPLTGKISNDLVNNLVEIGTGEGKSVVLAVTACVFALVGVDVNCSCYSEVLSTRDKNDFASVFRALDIEEHIEYGTFNKLCEQLLNEQCDVREKVRDMIATNQNTLAAIDTTARTRPKVLLIDEVDVFLSDKYYGGMYTPAVYLKDPSIKALLDAIWQNRTLRTLNSIKSLPAYKTCEAKYSNWIFLFNEAIKDMLSALQSYKSSTYIVQNDKIVYVDGESIVDNVVRGYDTVWAYYHENELGSISRNSLETNVGIIIHCGTFSYAEMPHDFAYIGGVSGTLKTLAQMEEKILKDVYNINQKAYMPSVYGNSNRTYEENDDVRVIPESEYFMEINGEIDLVCNASRAILVFFESEEKLMTFYNSVELSSKKKDVQIITEKVSVKDRELYIRRAASIGRITLLTRTFGRGTDFICRNTQLLLNGGMHVLQTFFSEELSEEYQIMGRGARQGDRGSYRMILLDKDLEWVLGSTWKEELSKIGARTLYKVLNKLRNALYESKCGGKGLGIEQCKRDHKVSKDFMNELSKGNIEAIKKFLVDQNRGANLKTASSRTVLLMDATGSMSSLLTAAKDTVCTMFERASVILKENNFPGDEFQMQFVVYRDYDCKKDGILQSSSWESKPNNLRSFMAKVKAYGGGDYEEAIEIGLSHAVEESQQSEGISQIILIGDAPAKDISAIESDRAAYGGEQYWRNTKYKIPIPYTEPLKELKEKKIPIHAFYLHNGAKDNFQNIARETSGSCERLDINSSHGAELLTKFVTEEVLRKSAGDQGDDLVTLYRAKYPTAFTSSLNRD